MKKTYRTTNPFVALGIMFAGLFIYLTTVAVVITMIAFAVKWVIS